MNPEPSNPEQEFKLGEVYNYYGFNFVVEQRDSCHIHQWRKQPLACVV